MQRIVTILRSRKGYVLVIVLCIMLILAVLGTNALVAAYARIGTSAQKKVDTQAYVLASSLLTCVGDWVQQNKFDAAIQDNLLQTATSAGDAEARTLELTTDYTLPNNSVAKLTLNMYLENVQILAVTNASGVSTNQVNGMLAVQVTAEYEKSRYTFIVDFVQIPSVADPLKSSWLLHSYRTNRGLEATAP